MLRIIFCLGSNIGDCKSYLIKATDLLRTRLELTELRQSSILQNKALLLPKSPPEWDMDFYNIAISGNINNKIFDPLMILDIIQQIEQDLGRIDRGKWSPREIDIDILAINNLKINLGTVLQVPHKELFKRDFFLKTATEIEPEILAKLQNE
jgi:2-amino-4-hydroxy-6-hydroxymethyldihydropteridine diphosphokinase